jgi:Protein of unknown function (DUF2975)
MKAIGGRSAAAVVTVILNITWGIVTLALVLTVVALVVSPFTAEPLKVDVAWMGIGSEMTIPVSIDIDAVAHPITSRSLGIDGARLEDVHAELTFPSQYGAFYATNGLLLVGVLVVAQWVLGQMRALFRTVRTGQPFVAANAGRLRRVGVAVIAGEAALAAIVYLQRWYAATHFSAAGIRFDATLDLDFSAIFAGLVILAIAEVFAAGTRLDEDQSLTI